MAIVVVVVVTVIIVVVVVTVVFATVVVVVCFSDVSTDGVVGSGRLSTCCCLCIGHSRWGGGCFCGGRGTRGRSNGQRGGVLEGRGVVGDVCETL